MDTRSVDEIFDSLEEQFAETYLESLEETHGTDSPMLQHMFYMAAKETIERNPIDDLYLQRLAEAWASNKVNQTGQNLIDWLNSTNP